MVSRYRPGSGAVKRRRKRPSGPALARGQRLPAAAQADLLVRAGEPFDAAGRAGREPSGQGRVDVERQRIAVAGHRVGVGAPHEEEQRDERETRGAQHRRGTHRTTFVAGDRVPTVERGGAP